MCLPTITYIPDSPGARIVNPRPPVRLTVDVPVSSFCRRRSTITSIEIRRKRKTCHNPELQLLCELLDRPEGSREGEQSRGHGPAVEQPQPEPLRQPYRPPQQQSCHPQPQQPGPTRPPPPQPHPPQNRPQPPPEYHLYPLYRPASSPPPVYLPTREHARRYRRSSDSSSCSTSSLRRDFHSLRERLLSAESWIKKVTRHVGGVAQRVSGTEDRVKELAEQTARDRREAEVMYKINSGRILVETEERRMGDQDIRNELRYRESTRDSREGERNSSRSWSREAVRNSSSPGDRGGQLNIRSVQDIDGRRRYMERKITVRRGRYE